MYFKRVWENGLGRMLAVSFALPCEPCLDFEKVVKRHDATSYGVDQNEIPDVLT